MNPDVVFTIHTLEQIAERKIAPEEVVAVLSNYDRDVPDPDGNRRLSGDGGAGRRLTVVVAKDSDPPRIITLWPTSRRRNR